MKPFAFLLLIAAAVQAQKFEVASVRVCPPPASLGRTGGAIKTTPQRLTAPCVPLRSLIQHAYLIYANGHFRDFNFYDVTIEGLPAGANSTRYTIDAKSATPQTEEAMNGPMLQALLEDRFGLKIHRETREAAVYELVAAKGGPRLKPFDGTCSLTPGPNQCRNDGKAAGPITFRSWRGFTIDDLIAAVLDKQFVGRPVINKTGIDGRFDIQLSFTSEEERDQPNSGPSIFTAIQEQLGLKLVPARGPEEILVIDHVDHPSEN